MLRAKASVISVIAAFFMIVSAGSAFGQLPIDEMLFMGAGGQQQRQLYIDDYYDITAPFDNLGNYLVVALSEVGTLSISLSTQASLEFGGYLEYGIMGISFSLDEGLVFISESATTPYSISTSAPINSTFGFAYVGVTVKGVSPDWTAAEWPIPFTIAFSLSALETADATE